MLLDAVQNPAMISGSFALSGYSAIGITNVRAS